MKRITIHKGELWLADMEQGTGSEQKGVRPVLILQNDIGNRHSPTTIIACLTSRIDTEKELPIHCLLKRGNGLKYPSVVMLEQIFTIDRQRLLKRIGKIDDFDMHRVEIRLRNSLGLRYRKRRATERISNHRA